MGVHCAILFLKFNISILAYFPGCVLHFTIRSFNSLGVTKSRTQRDGQEALGKEGWREVGGAAMACVVGGPSPLSLTWTQVPQVS